MTTWKRNEPDSALRSVTLFIYKDDGVTPAPMGTSFATGNRIRFSGGAYAAAAGTMTNVGVDGEWEYVATQAETNIDACEIIIMVPAVVGFSQANAVVELSTAAPTANQIRDVLLGAQRQDFVELGTVGEGMAIATSLLQGNFYMDNVDNSDPNGQTSARLRCFHNADDTNAATYGGSGENEFATFLVTTTYSGPNKITDHRVVQQ